MAEQVRILVVDDDERMCELLDKVLARAGYDVSQANSGTEGLEAMRLEPFDIVLTDVRMPEMSGLELLRHVRELSPDTTVVMMTAFGTVDSAVEAMKEGAYDYISKPFQMDEVLIVISRVVDEKRLRRELISMRQALEERYGFGNIIGKSQKMQEVYDLIQRVAPTPTTILIQGKSGTGKELVARAIYVNSPRKEKPFVAVNCSAIPEDLLESELFGHVRGSFTGAVTEKRGLFVEADGGTLFLDEVSEMGAELQSKLLRVLQERTVRPVGGTKELPVDVRVISATNQDLETCMKEGRFREDLFFRLNVIAVSLPELRERPEDIPLMVDHFLEMFGRQLGVRKRVSKEALVVLMRYPWPGNVRELQNAVERASVMAMGDEISVADLPDRLRSAEGDALARASDGQASLSELERDYIEMILARVDGNQTRAAEILGIDRRTLYRKLQGYNC